MRARLIALLAVAGLIGLGLGVRAFAGGAFAQDAGTALYAAMIYAGVYVLAPATRKWPAAVVAILFCWLVEFAQLTGVPAGLSARSTLAGLVLGSKFDAADLGWYVVGVALVSLAHCARSKLSYPRPTVEP